MPIQIIPKAEEKKPISQRILLYVAGLVFFVAVASFFIISGLLSKAEKNMASIMQENAALDASPESALEKEMLGYKKKIDYFAGLLDNHDYVSHIFPLIEKLAHPKVSFSSLEADMSTSSVVIVSGVGESFKAIQQQFMLFRNEALIKDARMSGVLFGAAGKIPFIFTLTLDSSVLKP
jgi:hypothetical protein